MKFLKLNIILLCCLTQGVLYAQDTLEVAIDNDQILDKVWFINQDDNGFITVELSSSTKIVRSKPIEDPSGNIHFGKAKNGFYYYVNFMRSGFSVQFRFNNKTKTIEAIGINSYSFGNAANDGSGESSINLITDSYIDNSRYYDYEKEELIDIPIIKRTLKIGTQNLSDFDGAIVDKFTEQGAVWFNEEKKKNH